LAKHRKAVETKDFGRWRNVPGQCTAQGKRVARYAEAYRDEHLSTKRRAHRDWREIEREILSSWRARPISSITRDDVVELVRRVKARGHLATAHLVLSHIKRIFAWAVHEGTGRFGLDASPAVLVRPELLIGSKKRRERVLTDDELRAVWHGAKKLGYPVGDCVRWIMLTGARRSEAAQAQWSEIDIEARTWTIPPSRHKSKRGVVIALSDAAIELVDRLPRHGGAHVFTTTLGRIGVNGWSKAKAALDKITGVRGYTLHDIRRTFRTRLSQLRIRHEVAEACVGHAKLGLAKTYDLWDMLDEKQEAMDAWTTLLMSIIDSRSSSKIVQLQTRRRKVC
jgi:integrase